MWHAFGECDVSWSLFADEIAKAFPQLNHKRWGNLRDGNVAQAKAFKEKLPLMHQVLCSKHMGPTLQRNGMKKDDVGRYCNAVKFATTREEGT